MSERDYDLLRRLPPDTSFVTRFGTVEVGPQGGARVYATSNELYDWAHKPGAAWPGSALAGSGHGVIAELDRNGDLIDMAPDGLDVGVDEYGAWIADVLAAAVDRAHGRNAPITAAERHALPDSMFGIPERREYPLDTASRARDALSRVEQNGTVEDVRRVRAAVHARYPEMTIKALGMKRRRHRNVGGYDVWVQELSPEDSRTWVRIAENTGRSNAERVKRLWEDATGQRADIEPHGPRRANAKWPRKVYIIKDDEGDIGEGPWRTKQAAQEFMDAEVSTAFGAHVVGVSPADVEDMDARGLDDEDYGDNPAIAILGNPAEPVPFMMHVEKVWYIHETEGPRRHNFDADNTVGEAMPDGSIRLRHRDGTSMWVEKS